MSRLENDAGIANSIVAMDGISRKYSTVRRRNLLHGWVQFRSTIGPRPDHFVELRWIPTVHVLRYLRSLPRSTTRVLVDTLETEVAAPFIPHEAERELPWKQLVIAAGYDGYEARSQPPAEITLQPTEDEERFLTLLNQAYLDFVADEVTIAFRSLQFQRSK